jgi:hypothetical protein
MMIVALAADSSLDGEDYISFGLPIRATRL